MSDDSVNDGEDKGPSQSKGKVHYGNATADVNSSSSASADISGGNPTDKQIKFINTKLRWEHWKFQWTNALSVFVIGVAFVYFIALLVYIFCREHTSYAGIPVILALSSIPTILTIALMRYFHDNGKSDNKIEMTQPHIDSAIKLVEQMNKLLGRDK